MRSWLSALGFNLCYTLGGRSQGASFATTSDSLDIVFKWTVRATTWEKFVHSMLAIGHDGRWMHAPEDVPRQLDRTERVFERFGA